MGRRLSRRTFLAGAAGAAVALPFLDIMERPARAQSEGPLRYLVCFAGVSIGMNTLDRFVPATTGAGYALPRALRPLGELGLQDEVTVVTGLEIPWDRGGGVPRAGRPVQFHSSTLSPLLSGVSSTDGNPAPRGPTSEQVVADTIGGDTRFRTLEYRVQAEGYRGGGSKGRMSASRDSSGRVIAHDPIASPRLAYDALFGGGFGADDPEAVAARRRALAQDRSVLDLVRRSSERLEARLGRADRLRLERHFDEIRDLERRVAAVPEIPMSACAMLADPGEDTPASIVVEAGGDREIGYADEERRAEVMTDLVHMAFTCDLTRSAALMYTFAQSFMNAEAVIPGGVRADMHELGHFAGSADDHADGVAWHVRHWGRLLDKLRGTPEGDGTLLDHCAALLLTEGGNGYDPEGDRDDSSHSSENMAVLLAGRAGGLRPRGHVAAPGAHPAEVIVSAMNAVGVPGGLGEVDHGLDALA